MKSMSDWRNNETKEQPATTEPQGDRSPVGRLSMQGHLGTDDARDLKIPDRQFTDAAGRDLTMRTYSSGDSHMVRVFDDAKTPVPPERASFGDAGRANLRLERDANGQVERARLQDIDTTPAYREAGVGGQMLGQCETIAKSNGAREIYGSFDHESSKETETRGWYADHGYSFRDGGRELYKPL
jgi:GNAT superfamily N-acetyltransferase